MCGICLSFDLFFPEGKDFHHQEGDRNAQHGSQQVADHWGEVQHIIKDEDDDILDKVVGDVGNKEFCIPCGIKGRMEDKAAVHPVGDDIAYDIADVEVQVVVWTENGTEPGDEGSVKGVDTADKQKKEKFSGEKMVLDFFDDIHNSSRYRMLLPSGFAVKCGMCSQAGLTLFSMSMIACSAFLCK